MTDLITGNSNMIGTVLQHSKTRYLLWRYLNVLLLGVICHVSTVSAADVFNGKSIYRMYCEGCHGQHGKGHISGVPNFTRGQTLMRSDLSIFESIRSGKNAMPGFLGVLEEQEMLDVIAYIRTMY